MPQFEIRGEMAENMWNELIAFPQPKVFIKKIKKLSSQYIDKRSREYKLNKKNSTTEINQEDEE